jgi:hypothetical protein
VNLISAEGGQFAFHISEREKAVLFELLGKYPVIEQPYQPLSQTAGIEVIQADQELLDQALTATKRANKELLDRLLANPGRFEKTDTGCRFVLETQEIEWVLQVLNDIRVGSWRLLGSPDEEQIQALIPNHDNVAHIWAMEVAGVFQSILIHASNGGA